MTGYGVHRMTPLEIVDDLRPHFFEHSYLKRTLRKQGYSRILAISKLFPRDAETLFCIKVAEHKNAVLVLFIDPLKEGYVTRFAPSVLLDRANP